MNARGYRICERCGEIIDEDREGTLCFACECRALNESLRKDGFYVMDYSTKPDAVFYGDDEEGRFGGTELEITAPEDNKKDVDFAKARDALRRHLGKRAYYKRDCSINRNGYKGFEIVMHPHTKKEFLSLPWEELCEELRALNYVSHEGGLCGLHVHVSRDSFGETEKKQASSIAKMIYFYDTFADDIARVARRTSTEWADVNGTAHDIEKAKKKGNDAVQGYNDSRYHNVNTLNPETIEVRVMRGTLNPATLKASFDFILTIARNSTRIAWTHVNNVDLWLAGMQPDTREYLKARRAFNIED